MHCRPFFLNVNEWAFRRPELLILVKRYAVPDQKSLRILISVYYFKEQQAGNGKVYKVWMVKFGLCVWSDRPAKWILREKEAEKARTSSEEVTMHTTEFSPSLGNNSFFSASF